MESRYHAPAHVDESRPSLGFPLGTALLLIIIFSFSGVFSCCYHWDKLRSLHRSVSSDTDPEADNNWPISKPKHTHIGTKQNGSESLPVLMPGDQLPKFIALPCPCRPPRPGNIVVQVQKPPKRPPIYIPVPLYF